MIEDAMATIMAILIFPFLFALFVKFCFFVFDLIGIDK